MSLQDAWWCSFAVILIFMMLDLYKFCTLIRHVQRFVVLWLLLMMFLLLGGGEGGCLRWLFFVVAVVVGGGGGYVKLTGTN